jgi:hypothetical protein
MIEIGMVNSANVPRNLSRSERKATPTTEIIRKDKSLEPDCFGTYLQQV